MILMIKANPVDFPVVHMITPKDAATAVGVWRLESSARKRALFTEVSEELRAPNNPTRNEESFRVFLIRFRQGPSNAEDELMSADIQGLDDIGDEPSAQPPPPLSQAPSAMERDMAEVLRRIRMLERGQNYLPRHSEGSTHPGRPAMRNGSSRQTPATPVAQPEAFMSGAMPPNDRLLPPEGDEAIGTTPGFPTRGLRNDEDCPVKIRPNDFMIFDPSETKVTFFVRRCQQIAALEGDKAVLRVLPMCLKGEALEWYTSLSEPLRREMNEDLSVWETQLLQQYRPNRFDALREAERLQFRFGKADSLPLNLYFTKKVNLLEDAGITDPDMIVQHLHAGLEPQLGLVSDFKE
jgi:hypothetical protein